MKRFALNLVLTLTVALLSLPSAAATPPTPPGDEEPSAAQDDEGWDDADDADLDHLLDTAPGGEGGWDQEQRPRTYPWFEHHGYFRFRSDLFWRGHLGTDAILQGQSRTAVTSGLYPPLSHNYENNQGGTGVFNPDNVGRGRDDETVASANMRFRYEPTLHLTSDLRIHAMFDVLDNIVLGSTPDFSGTLVGLRPDASLAILSSGTAPPESGRSTLQDSIRVKQAYGEWSSLLGLLKFGRMADQWGLGVVHNGGMDPDSDFGDYLDRVMWTGRFWGISVMAALDFAYEGPTSATPGQFYGQAYDLDQADDILQFAVAIYQRPTTEEDHALRKRDLDERRVPVVDWGVYTMFRRQDLDISYDTEQHIVGAPNQPGDLAYAAPGRSWDSVQFVQRNAWVVMPDIWTRLEWRPKYGERLHIELEAAFVYGQFNAALSSANGDSPFQRTLLQYGGVLQADYTMGGITFGLETGVASGDDTEGFGVLDMSNLYTVDPQGQIVPNTNKRLTNFAFDRDYHVDLMLFREVIGAVSNTIYFKPFIQYDLFEGDEDALGARLDFLYARALEPAATPGNDPNLGVELDLRIFYEERGRFLATLEWGILFPLDAFDLVDGFDGYSGPTVDAKWATTLQARVHWMF